MAKLTRVYSTGSFVSSAVPQASSSPGGKTPAGIYPTGTLRNDSPFGGSDWVKSDERNRRKKK